MKKIKLIYIHPYNYGNLMMASNFIKYTLSGNDDIQIYTDVVSEVELERLNESLGTDVNYKIYTDNLISTKKRNIVEKMVNKLSSPIKYWVDIKKHINKYDYIVYLGGDCISEYYSKKKFIKDGLKIFLLSRKRPVLIIGQTIGPFTSYRKTLTKIFLGKSIVSTRDDVCYSYLKDEIGLTNIVKSRDLAFLPLPIENNQEIREILLSRYEIKKENYITIVPSGLYKSYTSDIDIYIKEYILIFKSLLENERLREKKIVFLPHVVNRNDDDRFVIRRIKEIVGEKYGDRAVFIDDVLMAHEARTILGNGIFTITGRMHAAVSTFEMKKPAISLAYSVKYKGVIGRGLDMSELIIDTKGDEIWAKGNIHEKVDEKVKFVLDNMNNINNKIDYNVDRCSELALNQVEECKRIIFGK